MAATSGTWKKSVHGGAKGPGAGPGWGGPARGVHKPIEPVPIQQALTAMQQLEIDDPEEFRRRRARNVHRRERAAILEDELYDIGMDPTTHAATRVMAIDKALDRLKGKAIQPSVQVPLDDVTRLTDDELRAELESAGGTAGSFIEGTAAQDD